MSKAVETGRSFLQGVLAKLPESLRDSFKQAIESPEAAEALTVVGDGVLARSDYSRSMDAIREQQAAIQADYAALTQWYENNKTALQEAQTLRTASPAAAPTPAPVAPSAPTPPADTGWQQALREAEQGAVRFASVAGKLQFQHFRDFNEVLDVEELVQDALAKRVSVPDAYQARYGDRLREKAAQAEQVRIDKLVADRLAEERKKDAGQPFPLRQVAPSVLDVLEDPSRAQKHDLDAAVAEYERLQLSRGA